MTPLGLLLLVLAVLLLLVYRERGAAYLLGIAAGLPIGVAVIAGGEAVAAVYVVALGLLGWQIWSFLIRRRSPEDVGSAGARSPKTGLGLLIFFLAWSSFVSLVAPALFRGIPVLSSRGGLDEQVDKPAALDYTVSNFAQLAYTLLAAAILFYMARSKAATPGFIGIGLSVTTLLCTWRLLSLNLGLPFPENFFDNSPNVRLIESTPEGELRFRGIYSEPSSMGAGALTAMVFFGTYLPRARGWRRVGSLALFLMAAVNGVMSASATFLSSGLVQLALLVVVGAGAFLYRGASIRPALLSAGLAGVAVSVFFVPRIAEFVNTVVSEKVGSSSYSNRSEADLFSFKLMLHTWGFGVGLGSNRPSSLVASALSRVGVPGAIAFFGMIWIIIKGAWPSDPYRPTAWALASAVVVRLISGPGLLEPFMAICLGVLAGHLWSRSAEAGPAVVSGSSGSSGSRTEGRL